MFYYCSCTKRLHTRTRNYRTIFNKKKTFFLLQIIITYVQTNNGNIKHNSNKGQTRSSKILKRVICSPHHDLHKNIHIHFQTNFQLSICSHTLTFPYTENPHTQYMSFSYLKYVVIIWDLIKCTYLILLLIGGAVGDCPSDRSSCAG